MRSAISRLSVLILIASGVAAQTDTWRPYKNATGNFSASFPAEPTETDNPANSDQVTVSRYVQATADKMSYTVIYVALRDEQEVTEQNLQAYKDGFMKQLPGCSIAAETPASPGISGYVGHLLRLDCTISNTKMNFVGNIYWGKHYSYAVFGMFAASPTDPPSIKKFLDSFAVIDPAK